MALLFVLTLTIPFLRRFYELTPPRRREDGPRALADSTPGACRLSPPETQ